VDKALDAIEAAWRSTSSFSADVKTLVWEAIGRAGRTEGNGKYDLAKRDGKCCIRFFMENLLVILADPEDKLGKQYRTAERLYWVTDGEVLYQLTLQHGLHRVTKSWHDESDIMHMGGEPLLSTLRDRRQVQRLQDDEIDGAPVYVLQSRPLDGDWTERHWFQKETGIRVKYVETDADGEQTFALKLTGLKTGVEFPPDHFTLDIPEEAEFVDMTE
jgi:hypothetical protein